MLRPEVLSLNTVVAEAEGLLRSLVGDGIEVVLGLAPDLGRVEADRSQLEQVLVNLVVNARDAMPNGGTLTIETVNVELPPAAASGGLERAVALRVSDTGVGIDPDTRERMFEPFFTTKPAGRETGLGLAIVYGIVSQSGGRIDVESETGAGSTFTVYLPRVDRPAQTERSSGPAPRGRETILLVEDEQVVRELTREVLEGYGYEVVEAADAAEAIALVDAGLPFDLLLSDMVMPGMSGTDLIAHVRERRPGASVLLMSGYPRDMAGTEGGEHLCYLQKPFRADELAAAVRAALDGDG